VAELVSESRGVQGNTVAYWWSIGGAPVVGYSIAKEFVEEFHRNLTQGHNRATALVRRLEKEYIIYKIHTLTK